MNMDIDYIRQIADVMAEKSLEELSLEDNGQKISLKKFANNQQPAVISNTTNIVEEKTALKEEPKEESKLIPITSPMVGTFYSSASPDSDPFVSVGDIVKKGQIVCIVEAMKLMNEIESDVSGRVVEICVENGQTIEFGQVLMYIE